MKITLRDIGKKFNRQWVFKGLDFVFEENSCTALVGNNGSGKSTLLQIIFNYQTFSKGSIEYAWQGKLIEEDQLVGKIAFAAPYIELPEDFTLVEILKFHFELLPLFESSKPAEIIENCGLRGQENKTIKYFSSGMKQRLKLALAIYAHTPLLLLDEPCSNLDEQGIAWYRELIQSQLGKRTILIASNQLFEYNFCTDQLAINRFKP